MRATQTLCVRTWHQQAFKHHHHPPSTSHLGTTSSSGATTSSVHSSCSGSSSSSSADTLSVADLNRPFSSTPSIDKPATLIDNASSSLNIPDAWQRGGPPTPQPSSIKSKSTFQQLTNSHRITLPYLHNTNILRNPAPAICYEDALRREPGTRVSSLGGALVASSGAKTGRSPADKRIVKENLPGLQENPGVDIWWGDVNMPVSDDVFVKSRNRALEYLEKRDRLYVVDGYAGWDPRHRLKIRVVCSRAYHALFMSNMLIRPPSLEEFGEPDFVIYNAGACKADTSLPGITSQTSVQVSFGRKEMVILGTEYAGEMKKGVFTVMHYWMPLRGVLSLHASANEGLTQGDVSLFFGLSGTGKTTLSADPNRRLIGDDEHCWTDEGIFNIEGGCYAKAIDLSKEKEPEIFSAIRFGSVLENVVLDPNTAVPDYTDASVTENTRACYPIEYINNAKIPCVGGTPNNIILLTCDAFGVLPPVAKLSTQQAMYHFLSGYTAKVSGTEEGVTEPSATFSACFGKPFLPLHPTLYAKMLAEKLEASGAQVWLVNTGWTGGKVGVGQRMRLKYSRAIIDAIHSGELASTMAKESAVTTFPLFNLQIPKLVHGVPSSVLDPRKAWGPARRMEFDLELEKLAGMFRENFKQFGMEQGGQAQASLSGGP